jgi:hypothetical protein
MDILVVAQEAVEIDLIMAGFLRIYSFIQIKALLALAEIVEAKPVLAATDKSYSLPAVASNIARDITSHGSD